ncbi:uncharacterized protein LOC108664951 [Hyalella azteca]|uniref:Uncharacterized protein LOC108664951 n=1 Tax=Hyalella azteca TaxID=294128 RepID=A0A8B7MZZ6_HYAAZ|nr:uncharacterized protein LOC108664951 [Hyalella azteca]
MHEENLQYSKKNPKKRDVSEANSSDMISYSVCAKDEILKKKFNGFNELNCGISRKRGEKFFSSIHSIPDDVNLNQDIFDEAPALPKYLDTSPEKKVDLVTPVCGTSTPTNLINFSSEFVDYDVHPIQNSDVVNHSCTTPAMCVRDESIASEKKYLEISTEKCNSSSISPLSVTFNSSNSFLSTPIETVPSQQDVGDSVSFPRNHDHEAIPTVLLITSNTKAITTSDVMTLSGPQASLQPQCSTSHDEPIIYFPVSKPQCSTSHNNEPINHSNTLESQCSTSRDEHIIYFPVSKPQCSTSHNNEPNNHSNALESQCSTSHDEHIKFSKASEPQCLTTYGQPVTYSTAGASVTNTLVYYSAAHQPQEQSTDHKHPAPKGSSLTDSSVFCSNGNSDFLLASSSNKNVNVEDKLSTTSLVGSYIETLEAIQPSIDCISNTPIKTSTTLDASNARTEICSDMGILPRPREMNSQITNDKPHAQKSEAAMRPRLNSSHPRRRAAAGDLWCSECEKSVSGACTRHEVHSVTDRTVQSRAWESLPSSYLTIRKIGFTTSECYGVFCKRRLQLHTLFGPLQGIARDHAPDKSSGAADNTLILAEINGVSIKDQQDNEQRDTKQLIWPFTDATNQLKFLDTSDLEHSNWMQFVRPAESVSAANCRVVERHPGHIFFITTTELPPHTELRVAYSEQYAERYNLPLTGPLAPNLLDEGTELGWPCYECDERFASSAELQQHLACHDEMSCSNKKKPKGKRGRKMKKAITLSDLTAVKVDHPMTATSVRSSGAITSSSLHFSSLNSDSLLDHTDSGSQLRCLICKKVFTNHQVFTLHRLTHGQLQQQQQLLLQQHEACRSCPQCGEEHVNLQRLLQHIDSHALPIPPRTVATKRARSQSSKRSETVQQTTNGLDRPSDTTTTRFETHFPNYSSCDIAQIRRYVRSYFFR